MKKIELQDIVDHEADGGWRVRGKLYQKPNIIQLLVKDGRVYTRDLYQDPREIADWSDYRYQPISPP